MKRILFFSLAVVFTGIIFAPVGLSPCVQTEAKIMSVSPMEKVPLPRPFFRLPRTKISQLVFEVADQKLPVSHFSNAANVNQWCEGLEKEVWVRNYVPAKGAETATRKKAKWGVIAVDPKKIPLGSVILIPEFPGQKFVAEDTGNFYGWKIDICRNPGYPFELAKKFGKKRMRITIIKPLTG
ncbi:MAG: hypothetical protein PHW31_02415 [Candidatus Pacebacteria bacterium]|nr:hypothetical protein [Candidatus Paceibacterota bacterium]